MLTLSSLQAYEILASSGLPTLQVEATLSDGTSASASVPYGASAGSHEATTLFDNDERYLGKGMQTAISKVMEIISPQLIDQPVDDQRRLDQVLLELDGTPTKSKLGGNSVLAVSVAVSRAVATSRNQQLFEYWQEQFQLSQPSSLPLPMIVAIEGGKHAHNSTDFQEFCLTATDRSSSVAENIRRTIETYFQVKKILEEQGLSTNVGNEGAFAPSGLASNRQPLDILTQAIDQAGYQPLDQIGVSIDAAASEFFTDNKYQLKLEGQTLSSAELLAYLNGWLNDFPWVSIEDPFHEDDWETWSNFKPIVQAAGVRLIGDDLTVTDQSRLQKAIDLDAITGILIKLNQIGTVTETIDTCKLASQHNLHIVPSHRGGGETNDTAMIDLAVAVGANYVKVGPTRGERVSKYNRLMEIEHLLG